MQWLTSPVLLCRAAAYVAGNNIGAPVTLSGTYRGAYNMGQMTEHSDPCENRAPSPPSLSHIHPLAHDPVSTRTPTKPSDADVHVIAWSWCAIHPRCAHLRTPLTPLVPLLVADYVHSF